MTRAMMLQFNVGIRAELRFYKVSSLMLTNLQRVPAFLSFNQGSSWQGSRSSVARGFRAGRSFPAVTIQPGSCDKIKHP